MRGPTVTVKPIEKLDCSTTYELVVDTIVVTWPMFVMDLEGRIAELEALLVANDGDS